MESKHVPSDPAYLAAIVESSDDAIISKDLNGLIRSFNSAAERLFGYKAEEAIGKPITMLIPPDRVREEADILARLRKGERIDHFETVRVTKDGKLVELSLTVSPIRDATGKIVGASKVARDMTERNRLTRALAAQREWFRVTLASIGDGVLACDAEGRVTFMNAAAEHLTGWTSKDAAGRPLSDVFHIVNEVTREPVENPAAKVLVTGVVVGLANHTLLISRDGVERPIADSAAPIRDETNRTIGVVLAFRDATAERRADIERQATALERERLLQREQAARAEAERANRIKDDFVAMVSHELRTPLNAILGWTEVLSRTPANAETLEHGLAVIGRNTRAQAQLISDLLDISRIVSGKLVLEVEGVDLVELIETSLESFERAAAEKHIEIRRSLNREAMHTVGDPARLQQVLWNLFSNAIKFTPEGGHVEVSARRAESNVEIRVADSGIGIRPEHLEGIFERFQQGSTTTSRRYGGLGLGLSIAQHLVELHGGRVSAHSEGPGTGATFTLTLPIRRHSPAGIKPRREDLDSDDRSERIHLAGARILVVEDQADTRELLRHILVSHGAIVLEAESAAAALERIDQDRPDMLLSDIGLPDVDGYELVARIRQRSDSLASMPAIALTAFARAEDRVRAIRAGYQAHVAKPVEPADLLMTTASFVRLIAANRST